MTFSNGMTFPVQNYGVNENLIGAGVGARLSSVGRASETPLVADSSACIINAPNRIYNANDPGFFFVAAEPTESLARHLGGSNIGYVDGHVKWRNQKSIGPDATRASQANAADRYFLPLRPADDRLQ